MSLLVLLNATSCSDCGAPLISESVQCSSDGRINQHVNGQRWEHQVFACHKRVEWVPNFNRAEVVQNCANLPTSKAKWAKRQELLGALKRTLDANECDEEFRQRLAYAIDITPSGW